MPDDDLLRNFDATISGMGLDELRDISGVLAPTAGGFTRPPARPELRRKPRRRRVVYRVRVSLDESAPSIWRMLELRSDLTLEEVHLAIQAAFGWANAHLFRFSIGGHPFDWTSQVFLCKSDLADGEFDDVGAPAAADVRLDEALRDPGDQLHYVYDYGDAWDVTLRLEEVLPAPAEGRLPLATLVTGERAAPPEDSGGGWALENMAELVADPDQFPADEIHEALRAPYFVLRELGVNPGLVSLIGRLYHAPVGRDLMDRLLQMFEEPIDISESATIDMFAAHRWFLDRAAGGGIPLTSSGYLTPDDVASASLVLPAMRDWIGKHNREYHARPLLDFRESLQSLGLLRKVKGTLVLTRAGAAARRDLSALWQHLAERLVRPDRLAIVTEANLVLLVCAATSPGRALPTDLIGDALDELGWRNSDGTHVGGYLVHDLATYETLVNITARADGVSPTSSWISPVAAALARDALLR